MNIKIITNIIPEDQQNILIRKFEALTADGNKIRIPALAISMDFLISSATSKQIIMEKLGDNAKEKMYNPEASYVDLISYPIRENKGKQYIRFTDLHTKQSQWVMSTVLKVDLNDIRKYFVHHINRDRLDDNFQNLCLMFNHGMHLTSHKIKDCDLQDYVFDFIEVELSAVHEQRKVAETSQQLALEKYEKELREYSKLVTAQFLLHKKFRAIA